MKNKFIFIFAVLLSYLGCFAQSNFMLGIESGVGINKNLIIANKTVKSDDAFLMSVNGSYQLGFKNNTLFETNVYTQLSRNKREIGNVIFTSRKLKVGLEAFYGIVLNERFNILAGGSISNMADLSQINFRKPDSFKSDASFKFSYNIHKRLNVYTKARTLLNRVGKQNLLADPRHSFLIGLEYNLMRNHE